uniref:Myocardin related transcription factor B n=1 Tax=Chelonoidis abingdonii TaxID=106734 RepID=A0A8C0J8Z8_CHEAB
LLTALKSPAAFHEQRKSLERARTENFLKHKIRSRPDRSELVRMHILEETFAEPSLQATQMKLKRARLADDLNEKIAQRPGPMELVEKNILPVDSSVKEAIIVGQESYPQALDDYSFDEDSSDALSPDQPASQESQGSAASPGEPKTSDSPSSVTPNTTSTTQQSHPKNPNDKHRSKKCKEPKPRVKKLKYHQYIPPDQKGEKNEPQMDSNYARLLQQQQLFLQLQILSQQQQHYNYQTILPAPDKQNNNGNIPLTTLSNSTPTSVACTPRQNSNIPSRKPGPLPSSLDDLKVAELKMELKLRGLPVSGTKTDLIERLKPYQDLNNNGVSTNKVVAITTSTGVIGNTGEVTVAFPVTTLNKSVGSFPSETSSAGTGFKLAHTESISSPLPISPSPSEQSSLSTDDTNITDTFTELMSMMSPSQFLSTSPLRMTVNEDSLSHASGSISSMELDAAEKDRKLQEKEKQIEELKRKLEQEQKLVEVLKMQLEVEKRGQHQQQSQTPLNAAIKDENTLTDCCSPRQPVSVTSHSLGQPVSTGGQNLVAKKAVVIKQEVPLAKAEPQNVISQFYVSSQRQPQTAVVAQPQALLATHGTTQLLLPLSIQGPNSATSVQLPLGNIQLQSTSYISVCMTSNSLLQISNAHSQQMDDLFDILIKSGEISLPIKEEPSPISKMRPVTANITTMPVNTVVSRPPPQVQMAPPMSLEPTNSLSISLENQLEALLDGTLPSGNEIPQLTSSSEDRESFSLIEDLQNDLLNHSSMLDHAHSPMETADQQFTANSSCLSLDLPDTNLDNMEWLDITLPNSSSGLTPLSSTAPSMFSTDFLDPQDLQLHWD